MQVIRFDPQQMAQISDFLENLCDPAEMDREGLQQARQQVEETIGRLNRLETSSAPISMSWPAA